MSVLNIDKTPSLKPAHIKVPKEEIHTLKSLHELSPNSGLLQLFALYSYTYFGSL